MVRLYKPLYTVYAVRKLMIYWRAVYNCNEPYFTLNFLFLTSDKFIC